jgi:ubiquitin C-terminal hydrolase
MNISINGKPLSIPAIGFHNTGAICYFNSLVQCLLSSNFFIRFVLEIEKDTESNDSNASNIFTDFFTNITLDKWNITFTTCLLQSLQNFQPNQSSSEYFILMVDSLKWDKLFECQYKLKTTCNECGFVKEREDISYNVLINHSFDEFIQTASSLENVLCDGCHKRTTLSEQRKISAVSDMIVVCLNKYFTKHVIAYPKMFSLGTFKFRLKGSVEHFGMLGAGHYTCRTERKENEDNTTNDNVYKHYLIDDTRVVPISEEVFEKPMAETYMIFYERVE